MNADSWTAGTMAVSDPEIVRGVPTTPPRRPRATAEPAAAVRHGARPMGLLPVPNRLLEKRATAH